MSQILWLLWAPVRMRRMHIATGAAGKVGFNAIATRHTTN
jgi:hypothetical protein